MADDLISRQALLDAFDEFEPAEEYEYEHDMWLDMRMDVIHAPSIEAEPVRHGRWLPVDEKNDAFDCSECDSMVSNKFNYCPHCGSYNGGGGK